MAIERQRIMVSTVPVLDENATEAIQKKGRRTGTETAIRNP
jgi:hypothetical protein